MFAIGLRPEDAVYVDEHDIREQAGNAAAAAVGLAAPAAAVFLLITFQFFVLLQLKNKFTFFKKLIFIIYLSNNAYNSDLYCKT